MGLQTVLYDDASVEAGTYQELVRNVCHHLFNYTGRERVASVIFFCSVAMVFMFGTNFSGDHLVSGKWSHFIGEPYWRVRGGG